MTLSHDDDDVDVVAAAGFGSHEPRTEPFGTERAGRAGGRWLGWERVNLWPRLRGRLGQQQIAGVGAGAGAGERNELRSNGSEQ